MKVRLKKCVIEGEVDHIAYRMRKLKRRSSLWVTNMVPYRKIKAEIISDLIERQTQSLLRHRLSPFRGPVTLLNMFSRI